MSGMKTHLRGLPTKVRSCLRCSCEFPSRGVGNRICKKCSEKESVAVRSFGARNPRRGISVR